MDASTLETIYSSSDGRIKSTDKVIEEDINVRLNLNCDTEAVTLPQNRKAVLDTIRADLVGLYFSRYQKEALKSTNKYDIVIS